MKTYQALKNWSRSFEFHLANFSFSKFLLSVCIINLLSACGGQVSQIPNNPYLAPTLIPKSSVSPTEVEPQENIAATSDCQNDLKYVDDVTVPDGTRFAPRAPIEKKWLVKNAGSCNWDSGYTFRLISGPELGAEVELFLIPARSGSEIEIRILFEAPGAPGQYVSKWQAYDPNGNPFGEIIFIDIIVDASLSPATDTPEE